MTSLGVAVLLALGLAADAQPSTGDVGVIKHCVYTGAEGDECEPSCFEQREEEDGENGETAEFSAVEKCIDTCKSAYRITQLENADMVDPDCEDDDCEEEVYLRIKLEPEQSCVMGCGCPNATGYAKYEQKDDDAAEQEMAEYQLKFWTSDGSINSYFSGGMVKMVREEAEEDYANQQTTNDVMLQLAYLTTETNDDGEAEQMEENCESKYYLDSGKFDGFSAQSGSSVPSQNSGPVLSTTGDVEIVSSSSGCSSFSSGSADECFYHCIQKLEVDTTNGTFIMKSHAGNADIDNCDCYKGYGAQISVAPNFISTGAFVSFDESASTEVCSSVFDGISTIANITGLTSGSNPGFKMNWRTSNNAICTATYEVISGNVLGLNAFSTTTSTTESGRTAALQSGPVTVIIPIMVLILVIASFGFIFVCRGRP